MALRQNIEIAFARPGGETAGLSRSRPVDLVHLARQTMGDRSLEQEVLGMFAQQVAMMAQRMRSADLTERQRLAHTLKGSARSVGAFVLADCAAALEDEPDSPAAMAGLMDRIAEVHEFICAVSR